LAGALLSVALFIWRHKRYSARIAGLERRPIPEGALSFCGWLAWLEPKEESAGAATKDILLKRINYQKGIDIM